MSVLRPVLVIAAIAWSLLSRAGMADDPTAPQEVGYFMPEPVGGNPDGAVEACLDAVLKALKIKRNVTRYVSPERG